MKLSYTLTCLILATGLAKAESGIVNSVIPIAETAWAFSDNRGQHFEIRFERAGTAAIRRLKSHWVRSRTDPQGPPVATTYEIETLKIEKWVQHDSAVEFSIEDATITKMPARTHPSDLYSGTVIGLGMTGETKSETWGAGRWTAELIREPKERSDGPPVLLLAIRPDFPFTNDSKTGTASIRAKVSPSGDVIETSVVKASEKEFGISAKEAIAQWKFLPAVRSSEAVTASVLIPVTFAMHTN